MKRRLIPLCLAAAAAAAGLSFWPAGDARTAAQEKPPPREGGGGGGRNPGERPRKKPEDPSRGVTPPEIVKPTMADTVRANVYADNHFVLYINGRLTAVDSIEFVPHNVISVDVLPEYPMTIAVLANDGGNPRTGLEYGSHIGDGGFILKFADGTVTDGRWKAKRFRWGPLNRDWQHPRVQYRKLPENWFAVDFDDSNWPNAKVYTEEQVNPKAPFYEADFKGAQFIWTDDLELDQTVVFRYRVERPGWKPRWNTKANPEHEVPPAAEPELVE
ncbi:MAG TPA: hypothetical protein VF796_04300 [Humisphaera sp.]